LSIAEKMSNKQKQSEQAYFNELFQFFKQLSLPDSVQPDIDYLQTLMDYESKIDKLISKKRLEIHENLARPSIKLKAILRVHAYFTFNSEAETPSWELNIKGRILTNDKASKGTAAYIIKTRKLTSFIKSLNVKFEKPGYEEVNWRKTNVSERTDNDGFQIKRDGTIDSKVSVALQVEHSPHKYKLSESLEKLVGCPIATRQEILSALWEYIKVNQLQDKERKKDINCDSLLREIFNTDKLPMNCIILALKDVIYPIPKISFTLEPNSGKDISQNEKILDIVVDLEPPIT